METKHIYLFLGFIGIVLPYSQFLPWIADNGFNISLLIEQIATSRIAAFGWLDVVVSALALFVLILTDGQKRKVSNLWLPIVGTLVVGVSLGLPLYLHLCEVAQERSSVKRYSHE
jgi:hypothetical protein